MPIVRTYMCGECAHELEVILSMDAWDSPPPDCPECARREMGQVFKPVAVAGTQAKHRDNAVRLAEEIAATDYGVANYKSDGRVGGRGKVRYKDQTPGVTPADWHRQQHTLKETLLQATAIGRVTRQEMGGDGIDVIQREMPDLIAASKRKSMKVW